MNDMERLQGSMGVWRLFCLTACFFGIQMVWALEQVHIAKYLVDLGLKKSISPYVFIVGPLMGTIVQPYIGMLSDKCRSRFGRRRPFMVAGAFATIGCLMILVWSSEITQLVLVDVFGTRNSKAANVIVIAAAVSMLLILDFSNNVLQAAARALVIDIAPACQQDIANAWASRVAGLGDITGFTLAFVKLKRYMRPLGRSSLQDLAFLTSIALVLFTAVTVFTIPETPQHALQAHQISDEDDERASIRSCDSGESTRSRKSLVGFFKELWYVTKRLPPQIKQVCFVQLAAWVGWFPILFYSCLWVCDLYMREKKLPPNTESEEGVRQGSLGLLCKAVVALTCSTVLPWLVRKFPTFTLKRMWLASHVALFVLTLLTFLVEEVTSAIILIAAMGMPWAITLWVPFAVIAAEMKNNEIEDDAGAVLGIHSMAIALPQVIAILVTSAIFQLVHIPTGEASPNTTAWAFRFGGMMALVAAGLTLRMKQDKANDY